MAKRNKKSKRMKLGNKKAMSFAQNEQPLGDEIATREASTDYMDILNILPNPDVVLKKANKDIGVYRDLKTDAKVQAVLSSRKAGVKDYKAELKENDCDPALFKAIQNLFLNKWNLWKLTDEILEAADYGYKPFELIWEYENGLILPIGKPLDNEGNPMQGESPGLIGKPPEWFRYSGDNRLLFLSKDHYEGENVPDNKFVVARRKSTYANPYGEAVLAAVFWPVVFKKNGIKFWNLFTEKYGMPFLIGKYTPGAQQKEVDSLLDSMENMVQDAVAAIPDKSSIEMVERKGGSSGNQEYSNIADFMNREIAMAILGQNLTSDVSSGSLAAAEVHGDVKEEVISDDSKIVESFFNDIFELIRDVNYPNSSAPILSLISPERISTELAERDKILTETGVKFTKSYYIKKYRFEEDDFEVTEETKEPTQNSRSAQFAEGDDKEYSDQNALDHLIDSFTASDLQSFSEEMLNPIIKIIKESSDFSEALDKLKGHYPKMDSEKLEATLSQAMFVSETMGNITNE